jgi:hypothetical protein
VARRRLRRDDDLMWKLFAQEALGHNGKAVHRAYAKKAQMKIPSLEEYEHRIAVKTESVARCQVVPVMGSEIF